MYCSQCGKKLKDTMLFCPNCGVAIEFPDDEEDVVPAEPVRREARPEVPVKAPEPEIVPEPEADEAGACDAEPLFEDTVEAEAEVVSAEETEEEFVPLQMDETEEELVWEKVEPKVERRPPEMGKRSEDAVRLEGHAPRLKGQEDKRARRPAPARKPSENRAARPASTYVPPKPMDPDDMFMDKPDAYDAYDEFDEFDEMEYEDIPDDDFDYEDDEENSFFLRHIRGIMGFSLMALLAAVCLIYIFSQGGQATLAKMNLAWDPEVYSRIAYQNFQSGAYAVSGSYYEKALARDADNYDYAISAASAYIYAEDSEKAANMLKKSISLDPSKPEPYVYLMNIYPDAATRPWDVSQILQQGYGRTGDDRLKSVAQ